MALTYKVSSNWAATIWLEGTGDVQRRLEVTPAIAGWQSLSCRSYTFRAGQVIDGESATDEMAMVLLSGAVSIEVAGPVLSETWELDGRASAFDGPPYTIYLPPGYTYRTTVHRDADCVYGRAPAEGIRPPRLIRPSDLHVEESSGRRVTHVLGFSDAEHLRCEETVVAPETWAWQAADVHSTEMVIYARMQPESGWAVQRLYTDEGSLDVTHTINHGDAVIIRGEHRPAVTSPGTQMYALSYRATNLPD